MCPFCEPRLGEVVLVNQAVVALVDARPVTEGHLVVAPPGHCSSLAELPGPDAEEFDLEVEKLMLAQASVWGASARYEHDSPVLCRPHLGVVADAHAHCHLIPADCDLVGAVPSAWIPPDESDVPHETLSQRLGVRGPASSARLIPGKVPRHLVRTCLGAMLSEMGQAWIPLAAHPSEHDLARRRTLESFGSPVPEGVANA